MDSASSMAATTTTHEDGNQILADPLAFVIQECTFILSAMRKTNQSSSSPFTSILFNQFLNDNTSTATYPELQNLHSSNDQSKNSKFKDEDPFVSNFVELRSILMDINDLNEINILTLLQPFLLVIKSPLTSCQITDLTVSSLSKFFNYHIINMFHHNTIQAVSQIISTLAHCRFEGSDQTQDDLLLIKIIQLLESLVKSELGETLTDDSMYEIISTCFSLAINTRRRDMLRSAAENSLLSITAVVFSKLKKLESKPEIDHNTKSAQLEFNNDGSLLKDTIGGSTSTPLPESPNNSVENIDTFTKSEDEEKPKEQHAEPVNQATQHTPMTEEESDHISEDEPNTPLSNTLEIPDKDMDLSPYGIACMREFLNHTLEILLPENRYRFTECTKALALEIVIRIIEISGNHITKHQQLFTLIADNCCHHLVQIIQHNDSTVLIGLSLKLVLYFSLNFPNALKIQLELIFTTIFQLIINDTSVINDDLNKYNDLVFEMTKKGKFETNILSEEEFNKLKKEFDTGKSQQMKEFFIEAFSVLWCRSPYLFINLFKSYDCDFDRSDLSSLLIRLLCRLSYSDCSLLISGNVPPMCMEGLLSFVNGIHERIKLSSKEQPLLSTGTKINPLIEQYMKKSDFIECVKKWNEKPENGLQSLHEKGFINDPNDDKEVAKFLLLNSGRIDKKKLGELLAKPTKSNLLKEFVSLLDFKNLRPDESLRLLLNYFRLPGEAQQIDRIVSTFNDRYIECQDTYEETESETGTATEEEEEKVIPDSDAMYVLSFSIIMLNTDLHNPNVKKPMTIEDYQRNLRGCYKGKNFPSWYTESMYNSIKEKEIIMPEEHKGTAKWFETSWGSLVAEQESKRNSHEHEGFSQELWISANGMSNKDLLQFDKILFEKHCKDLISSFVVMFQDATHDNIITKMMSIVEKCSIIAIHFELDEIVDKLLEITSNLSTLTGVRKSDYLQEHTEYLPVIEMKTSNESSIYVSDLSVLFGHDYKGQLSLIVLFRILKRNNYKVSKSWFHIMKALLNLFENGLLDPNFFADFQKKLNFEQLRKPNGEYQINRRENSTKDSGLFSTFSSYLKGLSDDTPEPTAEEVESSLACYEFLNTSGINQLFLNVTKIKDNDNMNRLVQILLALIPIKTEKNERYYIEEILVLLEVIVCYLLLTKNQKLILQVLNKCDFILNDTKGIKMSTSCRILSYELLLIQSGSEVNNDRLAATISKIHSFSVNNRDSFIKHGVAILFPLEQLAIIDDSWCNKSIAFNNEYWVIMRAFASSPKNTENVYKFMLSIVEQHSNLIEYANYMDVLGLLDEISAVGAYGAQWEHEFDKLIDNGLKVDEKNNKNPYQELVNIASESVTLTSRLDKVIEEKHFVESYEASNKDDKILPWYPLIEAISHQCYNPCRQLRSHALKTLQNLLINNDKIPLKSLSLKQILDASCLRLLVELMKPEVCGTDVRGMIKTQHDVLGLACKLILNYDFGTDLQSVVEKVFAIGSQMLQKNKVIYPNSGHDEEIIEILRNVLMIKKGDLDLVKLKGYKMDGGLKKLVEEVSTESS